MRMGAQDLFWVLDCNGIAKPFEDDRVYTSQHTKLAQSRGVKPRRFGIDSKSSELHRRRKPVTRFKSTPTRRC
jgi:hypothetical protein